MAERSTTPTAADAVDDAIRRLEALDAAAGILRATAPALAAALGSSAADRVRWTPIGYLPDLTEEEWEAAAEESQARHRAPGDPAPATRPPAVAPGGGAGPSSVKYPLGDER